MRSILKPWVTYFCKIFKLRKYSLKTPKIKKKKIENYPSIWPKLRKKIGSNVDNLRNLEPQPEQTFLIKKISVICVHKMFLVNPVLGFKNFVGLK